MKIPFSTQQFFDVFATYNEAVWPMQPVLYAMAMISLALLFLNRRWAARAAGMILSGLWLWTGVVYHWIFFTNLNTLAWIFGGLFVVGAGVFMWFLTLKPRLGFRPGWTFQGIVGMLLILYALILYPLIGYVTGHHYPSAPTFGVPCPLTIFTLGILLLADRPIPTPVLLVPLLWAFIGSVAAFKLNVIQDAGLLAAAILTLLFNWHRHHSAV